MNNDQLVLEEVLKSLRGELTTPISDDDYFEYFSAEQVLKTFDPTPEQIFKGITDNGNDAGIDSMYSIYNGEIFELDDIENLVVKEKSEIRLVMVQSKNKDSYQDGSVLRTNDALKKLLKLSTTQEEYKKEFNETLRERFEIFRKLYLRSASRFPELIIEYHYVTKADSRIIHPNVVSKIDDLGRTVNELFSNATFYKKIWGANELNEVYRQRPVTTIILKIAENPISTESGENFIVLAKLSEYYKFICNEENKLQKWMFETNVRDYQGDVVVNKSIKETLERDSNGTDFWWLNNGVTILATRAVASSKTMHIENPEIVNGLQTSTVIHLYYCENPSKLDDEKRNILIRIIVANNEDVRDRIIRATNSQTSIPQSSLRATDPIHRDIEVHLKSYGLYYDRRKNHYKNAGKPIDKIISLQYLAQGLMAILLKQPNFSRARPSTLLNDDNQYSKLFTTDYPITIYGFTALLLKTIDAYLKKKPDIGSSTRNNIQFYLAYECVKQITSSNNPTPGQISLLNIDSLSTELLDSAYSKICTKYSELGGTDKVAKGADLINWLVEN